MADRSIAARFAECAARTPDGLAIATGSTRWTYAALADAVAALAGRLRDHGDPDTAVALALPHGAPLAIGVLATQQLGRPAVIVEPRMPAARQDVILADAGDEQCESRPPKHGAT